ncbi:hypothetical protein JMJ58_00765 [Haloterrigena salifodinae]|uniref:DUF2064 domain-containing protein n=2 Tax=Haloterrigena TaxID=121871 RepID=M0BQY5_9EURY|nr:MULTISPECIES: hypothetical protein [Haloterrigena]ELZ13365.1 hypothetical protein C477_22955 [Haloterrigena salina JCM 13891]QRV15466.1 hypothetical protein JMJ58_00765 [Haloterrigena salifodinae]
MIVVVPVDPPREGLVLSSLVDETPLSAADAVALYEAAVADVCWAVAESGGDLLVNYRDAETLPDEFANADSDSDPEAEVRALVIDALGEDAIAGDGDRDAGVRFEPQVGSSRDARIGNTVTHLLEREGADSVGVLESTAPLVRRTEIDGVAMSVRRHEVVLGPSAEGRTYLAGFREAIDFADAYATPEVTTLATRATDAGFGVGFAPMLPTVDTPAGLRSTLALLEARRLADQPGSEATAAVVDELGLAVGDDGSLERS